MRKDENGYIAVETLGSFTLLVVLATSILMLINITIVQSRIHYALTQTANELSVYSYVIHAAEMGDLIGGALDDVVEGLDFISFFIGDPRKIIDDAFGTVIRLMMEKHLSIAGMSADAYLKQNKVMGGFNGLVTSFDTENYFNLNGNVVLTVNYRIEYSFGFLPEAMKTLSVSQTAMTKAWLGGDNYD